MKEKLFNQKKYILGILCVIAYVLIMQLLGKVTEQKNQTIVNNTSLSTQYQVGRISVNREYSIVIHKKVTNLSGIQLKIKDLKEHYSTAKRSNETISVEFLDLKTNKKLGEKEISMQDVLLRMYYAQENSNQSIAFITIDCSEQKISSDNGIKIVVRGNHMNSDSEITLYANGNENIKDVESLDDNQRINGNILCIVTEGKRGISIDFLWGLVLICILVLFEWILDSQAGKKERRNMKNKNRQGGLDHEEDK